MNLSRPEQYLAPLLSAMETGIPIDLHREGVQLDGIDPQLRYPRNLAIIGTLNMDETTHGLSDKVLDRAFVLEFWKIDVGAWTGWDQCDFGDRKEVIRSLLEGLMDALEPARLHFGWRVIEDIIRYLSHVGPYGGVFDEHVDDIIYAKILPKLRGEDSTRFRQALSESRKLLAGYAKCEAKLAELEHDLETTGSARFWR
jgi:5-methylcytosine-specific restriction protein B